MAFQLKTDRAVAREVRRLARKELESARKALMRAPRPADEAIHDARKSVKKVRAILHLVETDGGHGLSGSRKRLRAVSRTLSDLRDAKAMIDTFETLVHEHSRLFDARTRARVRRRLASGKRAAARTAAADGSIAKAARLLRRLRRAAARWRPAHDGFKALAPGIRKAHRDARRTLARARRRNGDTEYHEWRKALKTQWYALRLVGGASAAVGRDIRALDSAETWLGDDHNLTVLCALLSADASVCKSPRDIERLGEAVNRSQTRLRRKAINRTRLVLSMGPDDYVRRVERAWRAR